MELEKQASEQDVIRWSCVCCVHISDSTVTCLRAARTQHSGEVHTYVVQLNTPTHHTVGGTHPIIPTFAHRLSRGSVSIFSPLCLHSSLDRQRPPGYYVCLLPPSSAAETGAMTSADELSGSGSVWTPTLASLTWRVDLQQPPQSTVTNGGDNNSAAAAQSEPLAIVRLQTRRAVDTTVEPAGQPPVSSALFSLTRSHCHSMLQQLDAIEAALGSNRDSIAAQQAQTAG